MASDAASDIPANLVSGRSCGDCTACCTHLLIEDPELQKAPGVTCANCVNGCAIYQTRPRACRTWFCGWRQMQQLGDDWRPDLCGVLIRTDTADDGTPEVYFQLIGRLDVVNNPSLARVVAGMISADVSAFLVIPGKPGSDPAKVPLNAGLAPAVANLDLQGTVSGLNQALRAGISLHRSLGTAPTGLG